MRSALVLLDSKSHRLHLAHYFVRLRVCVTMTRRRRYIVPEAAWAGSPVMHVAAFRCAVLWFIRHHDWFAGMEMMNIIKRQREFGDLKDV